MKRTPLKRKTPLRAKGGDRFPKNHDEPFRQYVRLLPCVLKHHAPWLPGRQRCSGVTECAHYHSRGAGGPDHGNIVPLCTGHHRQQHTVGILSFEQAYDIDLAPVARRIYEEWISNAGSRWWPF